jgi:hypothetical protein
LIATIVLFVAGGLADATTLGNSQLPTTLPASLARLVVMVTLGAGAGLAVASGLSLRPHGAPPRVREPVPVTS